MRPDVGEEERKQSGTSSREAMAWIWRWGLGSGRPVECRVRVISEIGVRHGNIWGACFAGAQTANAQCLQSSSTQRPEHWCE